MSRGKRPTSNGPGNQAAPKSPQLHAPQAERKVVDGVLFDTNAPDWTEEESPDNDPANADWAKSGSDFAFAMNAEGMRAYLKEAGISVEHFQSLPIYQRDKDKYPWFENL